MNFIPTFYPKVKYLIIFARLLSTNGYVQVCAHEVGHQTAFQQGNIYVSTRGINFGGSPFLHSYDGDDLDDVWEASHHLDPNNANTTGYYSNDEPGDNEFIADIQAISTVFGEKLLWQSDWANTGVQYGLNNIAPLPDVPSNYAFTFTASQPGLNNVVIDHDYPVKTINDLKNEYPNLITGLADLNKP